MYFITTPLSSSLIFRFYSDTRMWNNIFVSQKGGGITRSLRHINTSISNNKQFISWPYFEWVAFRSVSFIHFPGTHKIVWPGENGRLRLIRTHFRGPLGVQISQFVDCIAICFNSNSGCVFNFLDFKRTLYQNVDGSIAIWFYDC